ncbi:MAG: hypothetical protein MUO53_05375 [Maribacter sp.]|nr:hypothetical protein [Maribacter sp.]
MRKSIIVLLLAELSNQVFAQEENRKITQVIVATYDGKSDLGYRFIDRIDDSQILFSKIDLVLLEKFDLMDDTLIGAAFRITFGTEIFYAESADEGNEIPMREQLVILDLDLVD